MQRRPSSVPNVQLVSSGCRDRLLWTCEQLWTAPSGIHSDKKRCRIESQLGHRLSLLNLFVVFLSSPENAVIVPLIRPELICPSSRCSSPSGVLALLHPEDGSNSITSLKTDGSSKLSCVVLSRSTGLLLRSAGYALHSKYNVHSATVTSWSTVSRSLVPHTILCFLPNFLHTRSFTTIRQDNCVV